MLGLPLSDGRKRLSPASISPSLPALIDGFLTVSYKCSAYRKKCPIYKIICISRRYSVYLYKPINKFIMLIKLVSYSCVDNMQYYDAVVCFNSIEFSVTSVYYNVALHKWSVKVANKPLFETYLFCDLMSYLSDVIRDLFYR